MIPGGVPTNDGWSRLSPLSPLVRLGGAPILALIYFTGSHRGGAIDAAIPISIVVLTVVGSFISWLVTRWRISGSDLQLEMGLIRRQSLRIPLERIQAVDVVSPLLARFLGLAEVRVVSAGSGQERSRLAYLRADHAQQVRNQLLALAHGLAPTATPQVTYPLYLMNNSRFIVATLLRAPFLTFCIVFVLSVPLLVVTGAEVLAPIILGVLPTTVALVFALLNADWAFHLTESQDGFRLDRGLLQTRHETIPFGRIQAIRISQPLLWRSLGWYAIGVDVARQTVSRRTDREAQSLSRWLAPVVSRAQLEYLVARVCPGAQLVPPQGARVPRRAFWIIPFIYFNTAAWFDANYLYARTGCVEVRTVIVAPAKIQSIRVRRGPVRRVLGLADLVAFTAGRRWSAQAVARDANEANEVAWRWADLARNSRAA